MTEEGIVKSADGKIAVVTLDKKTECSRCGMCVFPKNANKVDIRAVNRAGAKAGDTVVIEKNEDGKLAGALLAFMVPLFLIAVAAVIGFIVGKEIWILLLSLIFIALWYTILAIIDKKLAFLNKFCAVVVKIKENNDGDENEKRNERGDLPDCNGE